jgi:lipopolysaccharide export system permease protein
VLPASAAIGAPAGLFAGISVLTFLASRKRPGENPVNWMAERLGESIARAVRLMRRSDRRRSR